MIRSVGYWSIAFLILLAPATAFASDLKIANAWVSAPILDEDARAYLVIQNKGSKARKLVGASSPGAESVEIHLATIQNGPDTSEKLSDFDIPAGGAVAFVPRGLFLNLVSPKKMKEGDTLSIELELEDGEKLSFDAEVRDE